MSVIAHPALARALPVADLAAISAARNARWRPGLAARGEGACHSEIFAASDHGGGTAAALALALDDWRHRPPNAGTEAEDRRAVLWVQTRKAARLTGRPCRAGLPPDLQNRVIHVLADKAEDALFALEEGLRCRDIGFVLGEVAGNPKPFDFTASRRLGLAAQRHGVPLFLVRLDAARDLSAARMRWEIASAVSPAPAWNAAAPGLPRWQAALFRARAHAPGEWLLGETPAGTLAAERPSDAGAGGDSVAGDGAVLVGKWSAGLHRPAALRRA